MAGPEPAGEGDPQRPEAGASPPSDTVLWGSRAAPVAAPAAAARVLSGVAPHAAREAAAAGAVLVAARATLVVAPARSAGEPAPAAAGGSVVGAATATGHQDPVTRVRAANADIRGAAAPAARRAVGPKQRFTTPHTPTATAVEAARRRFGTAVIK